MKFPVFFSSLLISSCTVSVLLSCIRQEEKPEPRVPSYPGTVLISAEGKGTVLGSTDSTAASDEEPRMLVSFSNNFYMDTTEVTIASYRAILGILPPEYDSIVVTDSLCPVVFVSWYDAILFCNVRSKIEQLDTVYRYVSISRTSSGSIYGLNGLTTNFLADGFRLPTEAEWVYAASGGESIAYPWGQATDSSLSVQYAWYQGNSAGKTHQVALLSPNRFRLYDAAGNVMEWVNDAKDDFCAAPVTDFAGAEQGSTTQRVLKGGSYLNTMNMLRVSRRSDIYPMDAATRSRRCRRGKGAALSFGMHRCHGHGQSRVSRNRLRGRLSGHEPRKAFFCQHHRTSAHPLLGRLVGGGACNTPVRRCQVCILSGHLTRWPLGSLVQRS